jgi:lipoprotein NlpI
MSFTLPLIPRLKSLLLTTGLIWALAGAQGAEGPTAPELLKEAEKAFELGSLNVALSSATKAIALATNSPRAYFVRAKIHEFMQAHDQAIADFTSALKHDPKASDVYLARGMEQFRAGRIQESVNDFDKVIELVPARAPYLWQRGISLYYLGRFEDGRRQFETHQKVNSEDVENAVWHYLCVARVEGVAKARAGLIHINEDTRVPMREIYGLYRGEKKPEDVLASANANKPPPNALKNQLLYAYLYLGLYFEAAGDAVKARELMRQAATYAEKLNYMGDVAKVHAALLEKKQAPATATPAAK